MTVLQTFLAHRDEFALVAGRAAAFGKPADRGIPEDVLLPVHDPLDIRLQVVIFLDRNRIFELPDRKSLGKIILPSELRILPGGDQILQDLPLDLNRVVYPFFYTSQTQPRKS